MSSSSSMSETRSPDSTYKGIRKRKWGKWVSEIRLPNCRERIWLGSYPTAEKAARAYDAALFCLRGPSAKFNFPDSPPRFEGVETLTQPEIASLAARYANGEVEESQAAPSAGERSAEMSTLHQQDDIAESSSSSPLVDWSYWDLMDGGRGSRVSDFSIVSRYDNIPGEFFPASDENYTDDFDEDFNHQHSFLWNF